MRCEQWRSVGLGHLLCFCLVLYGCEPDGDGPPGDGRCVVTADCEFPETCVDGECAGSPDPTADAMVPVPDGGDAGMCQSGNSCDDGDACTQDDRCSEGVCRGVTCGCVNAACCAGDMCTNGLTCLQGVCRSCTSTDPQASTATVDNGCVFRGVEASNNTITFRGFFQPGGGACAGPIGTVGTITITNGTLSGGFDSPCAITRVVGNGLQLDLYAGTGAFCAGEALVGSITVDSGMTLAGDVSSPCGFRRIASMARQLELFSDGSSGTACGDGNIALVGTVTIEPLLFCGA